MGPYTAKLIYTVTGVGTVTKFIQRQNLTAITVGGTLLCVLLNADASGPVATMWAGFNGALNSLAPNGITQVLNPTNPPATQIKAANHQNHSRWRPEIGLDDTHLGSKCAEPSALWR